ncbi:DUF3592 domain-containing protein [Saccharopolyspora gloriosae]|uniref:DUF3592 domain-containing protein n=1 Tax=Saccharopolyspora gloriosae TaxID=455344 RepID=UPI001FB5C323|nr:DUF3592 domain-containing protein [Saccharopolyspora gloriosae]
MPGLIFCLLLLAAGIAVLRHGGNEVRVTRRLQDHGVRTTATVHGHERGAMLDQPLFGYSDQRGDQFTLQPKKIHNTFTPVGDQADVLYLPEEPQTSRLAATEGTPLKAATSAFIAGTLFCLAAVALTASLISEPTPDDHTGSSSAPPFLPAVSVGILLLALTVPVLRITSFVRLSRTGIRTEGVVVRKTDASKSGAWIVDFTDHDGRRIQFTSRHVTKRAGARVPVVYQRDRPQQAEVASPAPTIRRNGFAALFLLFLLATALLL